ncbi:MAG: ATP-binding cassette domain-containing protein [Candidatus Nomurabacteria bacterium]|nr:ATP-binding cassette domain-containing protein [Candidatus Nomurabacteria bacterium]
MPLIEIKNLTKKFENFVAVDNLSLDVNKGEILGLLGPNGAGKTTTLSMLATLLPPTSGDALVEGFSVTKDPTQVRRSIGFVFQDPSSDDLLTGRENLYLHALMYGVKNSEINKKIDEGLKLVDLTDKQNIRMRKYSGGMRRRLELARGFLHSPKILFLDEPTLGLDPQTRENLWKYIKKLSVENKITIILTTHYMEEADMLCDRVAIIDHGKIIALNTPSGFKKGLGGDLITVKTKNPALPDLKKMGFIKNIQYENNLLSLTVDNASKHLQEILKKVGEAENVELHPPTLHDVFIKLTGRQIREESEGGEGDWLTKSINSRRSK